MEARGSLPQARCIFSDGFSLLCHKYFHVLKSKKVIDVNVD
jgi:hypothetical protein